MPALDHRSPGEMATSAMWNDIVDDLNDLTSEVWVSSTFVGIGTVAPARQLHVYGSGQTTAALTDAGNKGGTLYVQSSGGSGGDGGAVVFGSGLGPVFAGVKGLLTDGTSNTRGALAFSLRHAAADTALTEAMRLAPNGSLLLGDNANTFMTTGLMINQAGADDEAFALKSSDVTHTNTIYAEADTYYTLQKYDPANGGVRVRGFSATGAPVALGFEGWAGDVDTATKSVTSMAAVMVTALMPAGAGANLMALRDATSTQIIFTREGDTYQNGSGWTTYDGVDDVDTLNLLTAKLTRQDDPVYASFGEWIVRSREPLERLKLVSFDEQGNPFVNMSKLTMLLTGAVRQLHGQMQGLHGQLRALEAR